MSEIFKGKTSGRVGIKFKTAYLVEINYEYQEFNDRFKSQVYTLHSDNSYTELSLLLKYLQFTSVCLILLLQPSPSILRYLQ